jgi:hypothetical protein
LYRSFLGVEGPGCEANHTPSSHAEIKNEWSYNFTPPICLHGMNKENSTFNNHQKVIGSIPDVCIKIDIERSNKKRTFRKIF